MKSILRSENIRIQCKKEYHEIYKHLKGFAFEEFHELFSLCVILGYKLKNRMTKKRAREQLFSSGVFSPKEITAFNTLFIIESKDDNYSLLTDPERAKEFIQDYADGGMEIFLKSEVMRNFVKEKDGLIYLECSKNDHMQKQVMYYVYSLYKDWEIDRGDQNK